MIVKEALACDRPVVSVDVGDVRERIEDVPGCHIATADSEGLAAKLRLVHAGPGRVDGRVRTLDLSLQSVAVRLRSFYKELLSVGEEPAAARAAGPVA
jgi:glycosyltransferase involved in cell wall biosynthesis